MGYNSLFGAGTLFKDTNEENKKHTPKIISVSVLEKPPFKYNQRITAIIRTEGLIDKRIKINIYDDDKFLFLGSNTLLSTSDYTVSQNESRVSILLTEKMKKKAFSDIEGNTAEYFIQVEYDLNTTTGDKLLNRSNNFDILDEVVKKQVQKKSTEMNKNKTEVNSCFCNRDFTEEELKTIIVGLRKNEVLKLKGKLIRDDAGNLVLKDGKKQYVDFTAYDDKAPDGKQVSDRLFYLQFAETINSNEANYKELKNQINKVFSEYHINTCIRKIHFLAQVYHETQRLACTYESDESAANSGQDFYRGRGFIHVTSKSNYEKFYVHLFSNNPDTNQLTAFVPNVAKKLEYAVRSGGWYWTDADQSMKNINEFADLDDIEKVSAAINHPSILHDKKLDTGKINGYAKRKEYYEYLKTIFNYENCKNKK